MRAREAGIAVLMLAVGCVPAETRLWPSTEAQVVQREHRRVAVAEQQGVHLLADGDAWRGHPSDLENRLTPIYVRLENGSGRPLRLSSADFSLVGQTSHFRYTALPPLAPGAPWAAPSGGKESGGTQEGARPIEPTSWHVGVGGGYGWGWSWGLGWGWGPYWGWGSPYFGDPWYGPYSPYAWGYPYDVPLPTEDMLTRALPEGELEPGGALDGFLYFQGVIRRERAVSLQVRLVDARTNERFGTLDIPFQVRKD